MGDEFYPVDDVEDSASIINNPDQDEPALQSQEYIPLQEIVPSTSTTNPIKPTENIQLDESSKKKARIPKKSSGTRPKQVYKWIPIFTLPADKATQTAPQPEQKKQQKPKINRLPRRTITTQITARWIPKRILQEQGYYEGNTVIWLPKKLPQSSIVRQTQKVSATATKGQQYVWKPKQGTKQPAKEQAARPKVSKHLWRPKQAVTQTSIPTAESPAVSTSKQTTSRTTPQRKATREEKGKWVPKMVNIYQQMPSTNPTKFPKPSPLTHQENYGQKVHQLAQHLFYYNRFAILTNLEALLAEHAATAK